MFKQQEQWDYRNYLNSDKKIILSAQANQYFKLLEAIVKKKRKSFENNVVPIKLLKAFSLLSKQEQIRYITENLKYLSSINQKNCISSTSLGENVHVLCKQPKIVEVNFDTGNGFCFTGAQSTLKLQIGFRTLLLKEKNNIKLIDLQNYLVHRGQSMFKNTIQLQPIVQTTRSWQEIKKYQFTFTQKQFNRMYNDLFNCVMDIRNQQLIGLFQNPNQNHYSYIRRPNLEKPKLSKNKNQYLSYLKFKKQTLADNGIQYLKFKNTLYHEQFNNSLFVIEQSAERPNLFKAQILSTEESYELKQKFIDVVQSNRNTLLVESQFLEKYSETCMAFYENFYINETGQSLIYMREIVSLTQLLMQNSIHSIISIQDKKRYEDFMFIKSLDNPLVDNFMNFLCVFMNGQEPKIKKYKSKLIMIGQFNISNSFTVEMVKEFLSEYFYSTYNIPRNKQGNKKNILKTSNGNGSSKKIINSKQSNSSTDKNSKPSQDSQDQKKQIMIQLHDDDLPSSRLVRSRFRSEDELKSMRIGFNFLKNRFKTQPIKGYNLSKNLVKECFLKNEWGKGKNGSLVCTNQALLSEHKKLFKHIMATLGSNILKGNNILNVSLPVTIFKKEGHLQIIADSFSIAPILLQNITDPIQRIKRAIIISVAVGTLGISAQKPFFPTMGETLQVWMGGCPMYMQQILRYPPTSQYLFYGRGYKIYGQVQPKISFGINGAKGYSQRPSYIQFDDGQKLTLSYAKLAINGFLFGDREFNFEDKAFVYDIKNNLFGELTFGPKENGFFNKSKQLKDYISGSIYEVQPSFAKKFNEQGPPKPFPSKKYIKRVISQFEGEWDGIIRFDGKEYINFQKDLPSAVQPQQFCLPSDTRLRKDLTNLILGNVEEAQKQKQALQELQRRDRKLRAQKSNFR